MSDVDFKKLKPAVEFQRDGATWEGLVHVFDLKDSPSGARLSYAWSYERDDGRRSFFAVIHAEPIAGPREAVRAVIEAEAKASRG